MNKLKILFPVVAVAVLIPAFVSLAEWTPPGVNFPNGSPVAPVDESSGINTKTGQLNLGKLNLSIGSLAPLILDSNQGILSGTNFLKIDTTGGKSILSNTSGLFDVITQGIVLPRPVTAPSTPDAGTIYYDSTNKSVQLYDGSVWKEIGTGTGSAISSQWTTATNGNDIYYSTGNVGIGMSTPAAKLHVQDSAMDTNTIKGSLIYVNNTSGGNSSEAAPSIALYAKSDAVSGKQGYGIYVDANDWAIYSKTGKNYFAGNVGIGTTPAASYKLNVAGNVNLGTADDEVYMPGGATLKKGLAVQSEGIQISGTSANTPKQLELSDIYGAGGKNLVIGDDTFLTDIDLANTLGIYGNQDSTKSSIKLGSGGGVISGYDGKIGIGATSPTQKLSIYNGNIVLLREQGVSITPGPGPQIILESPSATVATQGSNDIVCGGASQPACPTDNTPANNVNDFYICPTGSGGSIYTQDVGHIVGDTQSHVRTVTCISDTSQYSMRTNNGTLEFLNNGGTPKVAINQDGNMGINATPDANTKLLVGSNYTADWKYGILSGVSGTNATNTKAIAVNQNGVDKFVVYGDGRLNGIFLNGKWVPDGKEASCTAPWGGGWDSHHYARVNRGRIETRATITGGGDSGWVRKSSADVSRSSNKVVHTAYTYSPGVTVDDQGVSVVWDLVGYQFADGWQTCTTNFEYPY